MKRRHFIQLGGLSTIGVGVPLVFESFGSGTLQTVAMERETIVIWLTRISGGRGHFGIDLILQNGTNPCKGRSDKVCSDQTYYRSLKFGTPENDAEYQHGVWIPNKEQNGIQHNFARKLASAWIEIYTYNKVERIINGKSQQWPEFMSAKTHVNSFNHIADGRHYSSHIGEVSLPRVNYVAGQENFGLLNGYFKKNGKPTSDRVDVNFFQEGAAVYKTSTGWPIYGFSSTGNKGGYYSSGPIIPARYKVSMTHWPVPNNKALSRQKILYLDILRPFERVDFDVVTDWK